MTTKPDSKLKLDEEMQQQLIINEADIIKELVDHATKQFYWGSMWARARKQERTQELAVETLEANLANEFRMSMAEEKPDVRVTERMVKEYILSHPSYSEAVQKRIHLGYLSDLFNVCKVAFETRGRLLLELAKQTAEGRLYENEFANMRNEFERREEEKAAKASRRQKRSERTEQNIQDVSSTETP